MSARRVMVAAAAVVALVSWWFGVRPDAPPRPPAVESAPISARGLGAPPPDVATGVVRDVGAPVAGAVVQLARSHVTRLSAHPWLACGDPGERNADTCLDPQLERDFAEALSNREADLEVLTQTTTDDAGRFTVKDPPSGSDLMVLARAGDRAGRTAGIGDVALDETRRFVATVTLASGEPVADARLVIASLSDGRHEEALSDTRGVATVEGLPRGEVVALVEKTGFTPWLQHVTTGRTLAQVALEVTLETPRRLTGLVLEGARPVPDVEVTLEGGELRWHQRTDALGRFTFDALRADDYELEASAPSGRATAQVKLAALGDRNLILRLRPGATLRGRVVDDLGAPVAGAAVEAQGDGLTPRATTSADGTFTVPHVHAERVTIVASAEGHRSGYTRVAREAGGWLARVGAALEQVEVVTVVEVKVLRLRPLAVRVVDESGASVPAFDFDVAAPAGAPRYASGIGLDGGFLALVPFTPVTLSVQADAFGPLTRAVDETTRALTVTLVRGGGRIEGVALDADRTPLAEWAVVLSDAETRRRVTFSDTAGHFFFDGVATGQHLIEVSRSSGDPPSPGCDGEEWATLSAVVDVKESGTTRIDVVAVHRARIEGTVAVGDGLVWVRASWGDADAGTEANSMLGLDGAPGLKHFCFSGLPPGPVTLTAESAKGGRGRVTKEVVAPVRGVVLSEGPPMRVSGTVLQADGRPAQRFSVNERDFTNASGRFQLALVEADAPLVVRAPGYAPSLVSVPAQGGDVGRVTLRLGELLRGRATDARDGSPVVGAKVHVMGARGLEFDEAQVDSDGWFEFTHVPEAAVGIEVSARRFQSASAPRPRPGETLEVKLVPADAR